MRPIGKCEAHRTTPGISLPAYPPRCRSETKTAGACKGVKNRTIRELIRSCVETDIRGCRSSFFVQNSSPQGPPEASDAQVKFTYVACLP